MKLKIIDIVGSSSLLAAEKASHLLDILKSQSLDETIVLDFDGYDYISSTFINQSIGQLCLDNNWTSEKFFEHFIIENIDEDDLDNIELAISNAYHKSLLQSKSINPEEHYSTYYSV